MLSKPWLQHILAVDLCKSLHVSGPQFLYLSKGNENTCRHSAAGGGESVHGSCVRGVLPTLLLMVEGSGGTCPS